MKIGFFALNQHYAPLLVIEHAEVIALQTDLAAD